MQTSPISFVALASSPILASKASRANTRERAAKPRGAEPLSRLLSRASRASTFHDIPLNGELARKRKLWGSYTAWCPPRASRSSMRIKSLFLSRKWLATISVYDNLTLCFRDKESFPFYTTKLSLSTKKKSSRTRDTSCALVLRSNVRDDINIMASLIIIILKNLSVPYNPRASRYAFSISSHACIK